MLRDPNNSIIDSSPRKPRFVLVPRAGLGKPWSASNANKPASSWPLKQGPKSGQSCDKGTLTVGSSVELHALGTVVGRQGQCGFFFRPTPRGSWLGGAWFPHCAFVASWLTDFCMAPLCFVFRFCCLCHTNPLGDIMISPILYSMMLTN